MAPLDKFWMLKASLRSSCVCKGEFLPGGRTKYFFDKETGSPLIASLVTAAGGPSPLLRSFGSYVTNFFSSSRIPASGHNPSTIFSIQRQALLDTEALSRVFATSSNYCPLLLPYRYSSVEVATDFSGSNLGNLSEAGLYMLAGQTLVTFFSPIEKTIVPKLVVDLSISGLQNICYEYRLCDKCPQMDADGVVGVVSCKYKPGLYMSLDSRSLVIKGTDGFCEENEGTKVVECAVRGYAHVLSMILENALLLGCSDVQRVSSVSIGLYLFDPASLALVVEDSHGIFAGKESSGLEISGYHELPHSEDVSRNLDHEEVQHRTLRLLSGACCLPHPNKVNTGGEDAYFICSEKQVVGVADGVGGWADVGVDAGDYARELMLQSKLAVAQESHGYIDPARVMTRAHARTKCRGSSTACILALSCHGLQAANLGDSGFILIRNGRSIFKSAVQQHQFNIPFQLESGGSEPPSSAEVFTMQVAAGDVLVAGTDGLFDNLYDNELMGIVIHSTRAGLHPQITAQKIAALARERAQDRNRQTPFSTAAQEAGFRFYGGKMDDITVVVSYVTTIKSGSLSSMPKL